MDDGAAGAAVDAIQRGDVETLGRLLAEDPALATARLGSEGDGRTLLHVATDWPGHFLAGAATVRALIAAGADVDAPFAGAHAETPLHWAASSDDVEVLDALIDAGAELEARGGVIGDGTPRADAVAFGQWNAARRLVERGARTTLWQAAALGLMDRVRAELATGAPEPEEVTHAFWSACHGGQRAAAEHLLDQGADRDWIGYDKLTPLDAARRSGADELVAWLRSRGARSVDELRPAPEQALAVPLAWLDGLRRGDLDAIAGLLDPEVTWRGLPEGALCRDRDEVLAMLRERLREGLPRVEAIELVAGAEAAVMGVRSPDLQAIGDVPLPGQVYNVLSLRAGRIVAIQDHATRAAALGAAGAEGPDWA